MEATSFQTVTSRWPLVIRKSVQLSKGCVTKQLYSSCDSGLIETFSPGIKKRKNLTHFPSKSVLFLAFTWRIYILLHIPAVFLSVVFRWCQRLWLRVLNVPEHFLLLFRWPSSVWNGHAVYHCIVQGRQLRALKKPACSVVSLTVTVVVSLTGDNTQTNNARWLHISCSVQRAHPPIIWCNQKWWLYFLLTAALAHKFVQMRKLMV